LALTPETFTNRSLELQPGDAIYTFTGGFPDQFGGPHNKKLKSRPFAGHHRSIGAPQQGCAMRAAPSNFLKVAR
jgi:serine phosphatase RsbU (regulator of sigma subunit)